MGIIQKILGDAGEGAGKGVKEIVEGVGGTIDKFIQTPEEKAQLKAELESEISRRWDADAAGKSWLARNVRPLSLVWALCIFTIMLFTDGNVGDFKIQDAYIPVFQTVLITILGGYFVARSFDKRGRVK